MLGERLVDRYLARISRVHDRTSTIIDRMMFENILARRRSAGGGLSSAGAAGLAGQGGSADLGSRHAPPA